MTHDWAAPGAYFILHQSIIRVITDTRDNTICSLQRDVSGQGDVYVQHRGGAGAWDTP